MRRLGAVRSPRQALPLRPAGWARGMPWSGASSAVREPAAGGRRLFRRSSRRGVGPVTACPDPCKVDMTGKASAQQPTGHGSRDPVRDERYGTVQLKRAKKAQWSRDPVPRPLVALPRVA